VNEPLSISFRRTTPDDLDYVIAQEQDGNNSPYIRQWTREKHRAAIGDPYYAHFMVERIGDSRPVGFVILIGVHEPDGNLEFKRIAVSEKGKGYGRQAVELIKQFAFEQTDCHRLWLEVAEHNQRAFAVYRDAGFVTEGIHREAAVMSGKRASLTVMSMLRHEYRPGSA